MKKWFKELKIKSYINSIKKYFEENKTMFIWCMVSTIIIGLIAHSYMFFSNAVSHDSVSEFVGGNGWKVALGRVFVPFYRAVFREAITMPWLIGVYSLIFIGLAVFFVIKIFDIKSKFMTVLISGIFTTNVTVIATAATYIHDLDCYMLSLFLAVLAVYLWKEFDKGYLFGMIPLCVSIGLYQSFLSVAITLIIIYLVMKLLDGEKFEKAFKNGLKSVGMIIGGGILYYISMKVICSLTGNAIYSGSYNSVDTILSLSFLEIIKLVLGCFKKTLVEIFTVPSIYASKLIFLIHFILVIFIVLVIIYRIIKKDMKVSEKILTLILVGLLPLSMNIVYPLTGGMSHDLMHYAMWLIYLFVLLISWWIINNNKFKNIVFKYTQQLVIVILVMLILCGNLQLANATYLKKDLIKQSSLSLLNRVLYVIEGNEDYVNGETPIVFVGNPNLVNLPEFERTYELLGSEYNFAMGANLVHTYQLYFKYMLMNPAKMADRTIWNSMKEDNRVKEMPCYPENGSVQMIDEVMVVKLGE